MYIILYIYLYIIYVNYIIYSFYSTPSSLDNLFTNHSDSISYIHLPLSLPKYFIVTLENRCGDEVPSLEVEQRMYSENSSHNYSVVIGAKLFLAFFAHLLYGMRGVTSIHISSKAFKYWSIIDSNIKIKF